MTRVLFVCLGNICRSPTAHGVFRQMVDARGLSGRIEVDSCGTAHWHAGEAPDPRSTEEAARRGYRLGDLRARQVQPDDFARFDYILAMDLSNLADLQAVCPADFDGHLGLFLDFAADSDTDEVPDPYYGGGEGFTRVLDLVEAASEGLLDELDRRGHL
ncbi:MAG: phosphotyrosine protein phosphatase [Halioglobus sp.]|nr:phosphotyrosine protein phosphatase [Halioglobus sp.]